MPAPVTQPSSVRDAESEEDIAAILRGERRRPARPSSFAYVAVRHAMRAVRARRPRLVLVKGSGLKAHGLTALELRQRRTRDFPAVIVL